MRSQNLARLSLLLAAVALLPVAISFVLPVGLYFPSDWGFGFTVHSFYWIASAIAVGFMLAIFAIVRREAGMSVSKAPRFSRAVPHGREYRTRSPADSGAASAASAC